MDVFMVAGGASAPETTPISAVPAVPEIPPLPAPELAGPPDEQAKNILRLIQDAYARKDLDGIVQYLSPTAVIALPSGRQDVSTYRRTLGSLFMALDNPRWEYEIVSVSPDPKSGAIRVRVQSTYSANLIELIGVNPAALERAGEPPALQSRVLESFKASAGEIFEFRPDVSGQMRIVELASVLRLDPTIADQIAELTATWESKVAIVSLFFYLEEKEVDKFASLIHEKFINNDDNSFNHGRTEFLESVRADLDHLSNFDHGVRVESILFNSDRSEARVPVTWDRRARIGNTKSEWTVKDRKTVFTLKRGSGFKLAQIEGSPLFGNSSFLTRKTLINAGEVDAAKVTKAIVVDDKRETAAASSADVPELPAEQLSSLSVSSEVTGSISSSPTTDQTWTGNVALMTSMTIPASVTITIKAATVTVANNVAITVEGTVDATSASTTFSMGTGSSITINGIFNATSATFKKSSGADTWSGITTGSAATVTLSSCTLQDADTLVTVNGGAPTFQNGTVKPGFCAFYIKGGSPSISNITFTSNTGAAATAYAMIISAGTTITFSDNTISNLTGPVINGFRRAVQINSTFSGTYNSSRNVFDGNAHYANTPVGVMASTSNATLNFTNDVYKNWSNGIRSAGANEVDEDDDGSRMTVTNCDFSRGPLVGGNGTGDGTPSNVLNGCYFDNSGNGTSVDTGTTVPDSASFSYEDVSSVSNPRSTKNN